MPPSGLWVRRMLNGVTTFQGRCPASEVTDWTGREITIPPHWTPCETWGSD